MGMRPASRMNRGPDWSEIIRFIILMAMLFASVVAAVRFGIWWSQ